MGNERDKTDPDVEFDADLHGEIETDSTGKNILIRDPDASIDTSELEILDYSPPQKDPVEDADDTAKEDESDPYDPYNSGIYDVLDEDEPAAPDWDSTRRK